MTEYIYSVHPESQNLSRAASVTFSEIGIRERKDLQEWVIRYPDILGESLLVITSEFDGFDKASRRLDILALDKRGILVVVELKLEVENTFADLQAIRYAAFCHTMSMEQVVSELARFKGKEKLSAEQIIQEFLDVDELPTLGSPPRIIIAASNMNNIELTSSVLWLRDFGVDITCVELTPFIIPEDNKLLLAPKVIIPLPEAKEYQVRVERKQAKQAQEQRVLLPLGQFWSELVPMFNNACPKYEIIHKPRNNYYFVSIQTGIKWVHYEWVIQGNKELVMVAIHFESDDREQNIAFCTEFYNAAKHTCDIISKEESCQFIHNRFLKKWASCFFEVPFAGSLHSEQTVSKSAAVMCKFIDRTNDLLQGIVEKLNWPTLNK